jgi:hypothetical protein
MYKDKEVKNVKNFFVNGKGQNDKQWPTKQYTENKVGTGYEYDGNVFVARVLQVRRAEVVTK